MKQFLIFTALSTLAFSCSNGEKKIISVEKKVVHTATVPVAATTKLNVEIAGMSCEHACGGSIRMALKDTKAVDRVSFPDFNADNKFNSATITYDKNKISESQILSIIKDLNDNQFTTGKVITEEISSDKLADKNS